MCLWSPPYVFVESPLYVCWVPLMCLWSPPNMFVESPLSVWGVPLAAGPSNWCTAVHSPGKEREGHTWICIHWLSIWPLATRSCPASKLWFYASWSKNFASEFRFCLLAALHSCTLIRVIRVFSWENVKHQTDNTKCHLTRFHLLIKDKVSCSRCLWPIDYGAFILGPCDYSTLEPRKIPLFVDTIRMSSTA